MNRLPAQCRPAAGPLEASAPLAVPSRLEELFVVAMLCVFCSLPFLLGDQPTSLTSVKETGITSSQGDTAKQLILLAIYGLTAAALLPRLDIAARRAISLPLMMLLAWLALTAIWSDMPGVTLRRIVALTGTLAMGVYMALRWPPQPLARLLSQAALVVLGCSFVVAIAMPAAGLDPELRLRGVFAHKNSLAAFAALAILCAADAFAAGGKAGRLAIVTGLSGLLALLLTASASPIPAVAVAVWAIFRVARAAPGSQHRDTTRLCTALVVGAAALPWVAPYIGEIALLFGRDTDFSGRTLVWRFCLEFFQRNPLFGYGYAAFWNGPAGLLFVQYAHFPVPHAHNGPLQLLLDAGAIGLALYASVFAAAIGGLHRILNSSARGAHAWLAGLLVLYVFANLAETHLLEPNDLYTVLFAYAVVRINLVRGHGIEARQFQRVHP